MKFANNLVWLWAAVSTYALILAISIKQFYVSLPYENLRGYNAELIYNINQRDKSQHLTRARAIGLLN